MSQIKILASVLGIFTFSPYENISSEIFSSLQNQHTLAGHMLETIDHVNIVVEDLEGMADFYTRSLGMTISKRATISGPWIDRTVGLAGVHADVIYLDLPAGPRLELLRYNQPPGRRPDSLGQSNTRGLRHLAFKVHDIEQIQTRLRDAGVHFFSDIQLVPDSQVTYAAGLRKFLAYFHDPEGNLLELCEYRKRSVDSEQ